MRGGCGAVGRDRERGPERAHDVGDLQVRHGAPRGRLVDVGAAAQQLGGVDRAVGQHPGDGGGDRDREHHRQGQREVAGHLDHAGQRGQRGAGGGGEHRAHRDDRVQRGLPRPGANAPKPSQGCIPTSVQ